MAHRRDEPAFIVHYLQTPAAMVVLGPLLMLVGDGAGTGVDAFQMATSMTLEWRHG